MTALTLKVCFLNTLFSLSNEGAMLAGRASEDVWTHHIFVTFKLQIKYEKTYNPIKYVILWKIQKKMMRL